MPQFFIPLIVGAGAAVGVAVSVGVATAIYYVGATIVTSYAINALSKKALSKARSAAASVQAAQKGYGTNVNAVAPASDHAIIYG